MIFFWLIIAIKRIVWLLRPPKLDDLAYIDVNARCPVCGHRSGRLRCVLKRKDGPVAKDAVDPLVAGVILCQHTCTIDGARWFEKPILKGVNPSTVLPAVPRDELEAKEDRQAFLQFVEQPINQ